jgi:hypothetical protein
MEESCTDEELIELETTGVELVLSESPPPEPPQATKRILRIETTQYFIKAPEIMS